MDFSYNFPSASTFVVVGIAVFNAILVSVLAGRKHYPAGNAVLEWITPIWLFFVAQCLVRGGCSILVWIEAARQALTAIILVIHAVNPGMMDKVKQFDATGRTE